MDNDLRGNYIDSSSARAASSSYVPGEPQSSAQKYFSRKEIEFHSPSRKDGIDLLTEAYLRSSYCKYIQELGIALKVPQLTIATALMFCHRFYMGQSHTKNDWQTVATVCIYLACKSEESPRVLRDVIVVAYEVAYKWDPSAPRRIRQQDVYDKQKQLILSGERLLLSTIAFELNVQHPYKPLVAALKRLEISHSDLVKVAWNFVNDWLCTILCLQYKPHYIAAGSLFLAARFLKVKLPTGKGKAWWLEFDVFPKQLNEVIDQMIKVLEGIRKQPQASSCARVNNVSASVKDVASPSPQSCILNGPAASRDSDCGPAVEIRGCRKPAVSNCGQGHSQIPAAGVSQYEANDTGSATGSIVEDGDGWAQPDVRVCAQRSGDVSAHGCYSQLGRSWSTRPIKIRRCHTASGIGIHG